MSDGEEDYEELSNYVSPSALSKIKNMDKNALIKWYVTALLGVTDEDEEPESWIEGDIVYIILPTKNEISINTKTGEVSGEKVFVLEAVAAINRKYGVVEENIQPNEAEAEDPRPYTEGGKKKRKTRRGKKKTRRGKKNTRKSVNRRRQ